MAEESEPKRQKLDNDLFVKGIPDDVQRFLVEIHVSDTGNGSRDHEVLCERPFTELHEALYALCQVLDTETTLCSEGIDKEQLAKFPQEQQEKIKSINALIMCQDFEEFESRLPKKFNRNLYEYRPLDFSELEKLFHSGPEYDLDVIDEYGIPHNFYSYFLIRDEVPEFMRCLAFWGTNLMRTTPLPKKDLKGKKFDAIFRLTLSEE